MKTDQYALITGASSGIGEALAREYARRGKPLILTARRKERLDALAAELGQKVPVVVLAADLADPKECAGFNPRQTHQQIDDEEWKYRNQTQREQIEGAVFFKSVINRAQPFAEFALHPIAQ